MYEYSMYLYVQYALYSIYCNRNVLACHLANDLSRFFASPVIFNFFNFIMINVALRVIYKSKS